MQLHPNERSVAGIVGAIQISVGPPTPPKVSEWQYELGKPTASVFCFKIYDILFYRGVTTGYSSLIIWRRETAAITAVK